MKRGQEDNSAEDNPLKQPKLGEDQEDNDEVPDEGNNDNHQEQAPAVAIVQQEQAPAMEYLKPELAVEIYNALPAIHQLRLLPLSQHIAEKGPSPDAFTRFMKLRWMHNRWMENSPDRSSQVSANGLSVSHDVGVTSNYPNVRAILGIEFPPTQLAGPQVCYYEMKRMDGGLFFGFCARNTVYPTSADIFGVEDRVASGVYIAGHTKKAFPFFFNDPNEVATIGCGLIKQFGERTIFFTKNGEIIEKPILLPPSAPNELFPFIWTDDVHRLEDTTFGLQPFQFKYQGNEAKLAEKIVWE